MMWLIISGVGSAAKLAVGGGRRGR